MADERGRIILEPVGDGTRYRVQVEDGNVEGHGFRIKLSESEEGAEGHGFKFRGFSVEPDGTDADGEPLFRLTGEDAEGHARRFFR